MNTPFLTQRFHLAFSASVLLALGAAQVMAADYLDQGMAMYGQRKFADAARCLEAKLALSPTDPFALYYAALSYHQLRNFVKARACYQKLVEVAPDSEMGQKAVVALKQFGPAPTEKKPAPAAGSATARSSAAAPADSTPDWATLPQNAKVFFEYDQRSGIMVEPTINGRTVRMVFDTGAPGVVIGKSQLEDAGLPVPSGKPSGRGGGAGTQAMVDCWEITADITLGNIKRKNVIVTVMDKNSCEPLLGQSFFKDYAFTVDKGASAITFNKKSASAPQVAHKADSSTVPFKFASDLNRILVTVLVNGRPCEMIFDTGNANAPVCFENDQQVKDAGLTIPDDAEVQASRGVAGSANSKKFYVSKMQLGPIERFDVPVVAANGMLERPLLGQSFWEDWQYTIDMDRKVIRFVRR